MATVKFVHFGADEAEIGIQFVTDDGAGGTVTGRAFAAADPTMKQRVIAAAQAALDAMTGELPADYQPGAVTTALMKKRNAEQEASKANARKMAADEAASKAAEAKAASEQAMAEAEARCAAAMAEVEALQARKAAIEAEIAAKTAEPTP